MVLRKANKKKLKDCLEVKIEDNILGKAALFTYLVIDGVRINGDVLFYFKDENGKEKEIHLYDLNHTRGFNYSYIKDYYIESIKSSFTVDYSDHWINPMVTVNLVKKEQKKIC